MGETDHSGRRKYQKTKFSLTFLKRQKWKNKDWMLVRHKRKG